MANLASKLLKKIVLILAFILSFPFSLLYWPIKSVFSKHCTQSDTNPLPTQKTAQPPAPVVGLEPVAQSESAVTPAATAETTITPQQPAAAEARATTTVAPLIQLGRRGGAAALAAAQQAAQVQAADYRP